MLFLSGLHLILKFLQVDLDRWGLCRKFQFWGQNPKTRHRQFNDLQTTKLSKKQICDRAV